MPSLVWQVELVVTAAIHFAERALPSRYKSFGRCTFHSSDNSILLLGRYFCLTEVAATEPLSSVRLDRKLHPHARKVDSMWLKTKSRKSEIDNAECDVGWYHSW